MKVLLLGAGGFIGANLAARLAHDGVYRLTALDVCSKKLDEALGPAAGDVRRVEFDIRDDRGLLEPLVAGHDLVVDLVAVANPSVYVSDPLEVFKLNFTENLRIAEYCVRHWKRLIQFSTCEVYGKTAAAAIGVDPASMPCPFSEDSSPLILGPVGAHRWIYACAKQLLERVLHAYGLQGRLNWTVIRPFNLIGPRIDYLPSERAGNPRVFSHFMNALLYGTPMKLVDGGRNYRAYTYIDDAVECIARIVDNPGGVCDRQIFNVGTPENEVTIRQFAHLMKDVFDEHFREDGDPEVQIVSVPAEEFYGPGYDDCDRRIPDVTKARTLLGWRSRHDVRSTVFHTMRYFVEKLRARQGACQQPA